MRFVLSVLSLPFSLDVFSGHDPKCVISGFVLFRPNIRRCFHSKYSVNCQSFTFRHSPHTPSVLSETWRHWRQSKVYLRKYQGRENSAYSKTNEIKKILQFCINVLLCMCLECQIDTVCIVEQLMQGLRQRGVIKSLKTFE